MDRSDIEELLSDELPLSDSTVEILRLNAKLQARIMNNSINRSLKQLQGLDGGIGIMDCSDNSSEGTDVNE